MEPLVERFDVDVVTYESPTSPIGQMTPADEGPQLTLPAIRVRWQEETVSNAGRTYSLTPIVNNETTPRQPSGSFLQNFLTFGSEPRR